MQVNATLTNEELGSVLQDELAATTAALASVRGEVRRAEDQMQHAIDRVRREQTGERRGSPTCTPLVP